MYLPGAGIFLMQLHHTETVVLGIGKTLTGALPTTSHSFFLSTEYCEIL